GDGRGDGVADVGSAMVGAGGMAGLIVSGVTRTSGRGGGTAVGGDADGDELRDAGTRGTARVVGSTDAALRRDMPTRVASATALRSACLMLAWTRATSPLSCLIAA